MERETGDDLASVCWRPGLDQAIGLGGRCEGRDSLTSQTVVPGQVVMEEDLQTGVGSVPAVMSSTKLPLQKADLLQLLVERTVRVSVKDAIPQGPETDLPQLV